MTLSIHIDVPAEIVRDGSASDYLATAMSAIGFSRGAAHTFNVRYATPEQAAASHVTMAVSEAQQAEAAAVTEIVDTPPATEAVDRPAIRLRGKASGPGRRTKIEMQEDEDLEKLAKKAKVPIEKVDEHLANGVSREQVISGLNEIITPPAQPQNISTGEERIDPADAADEAAESAAARVEGTPETLRNDLRNACGKYMKKYGMAAAQEDIPNILGKKQADVEDADLAKAIGDMEFAVENDPLGRLGGAKTEEPAPAATREDLIAAMKAYQEKHGGEKTQADGRAIFDKALGPVPEGTKDGKGDVVSSWKLSAVPNDPAAFAKCVAAWKEALG
jgi:hypothetical protein